MSFQNKTENKYLNFHLSNQKISHGHYLLQQYPIGGNGLTNKNKMNMSDGEDGFKSETRDLG